MKKIFALVFSTLLIFWVNEYARPKRVNQIPNGEVNRCENCHVDPEGGGPRNAFGQMVEANFLTVPGSAGDVIWGAELARLDADGDGFTNGEELQDSAGIWTGGPIGNPNLVFLPGDPANHPPLTSVESAASLPKVFSLSQNYPNPFNPETLIPFSIPKAANVKLVVYDALGREVAVLVNDFLNRGFFEVVFDAKSFSSGVYFYRITAGEFTKIRKMTLLK